MNDKDNEIEEQEVLTEEEIIKTLKVLLMKEHTIKELADLFKISEMEVMGYQYRLTQEGIGVDYYEKDNEAYLIRNDHPDLSKENAYEIKVDGNVKFAVISDLRFGSKYEQISVLNDMYKKFKQDGIEYVIVAGNLVEGPYNGKTALEYGKSLYTNDAEGQADLVIQYFPKVEGIKTLFITGELDHKWSKKLNLGNYIESQRDDMIYLGPISATVYFNNSPIHIEQLKNGNTYTVAYPQQQYSRSLQGTEQYDAIMLSGTQTMQHFPSIRDTEMFSIPSVVDRTPKMAASKKINQMGAIEFDLQLDRFGKKRKIVPTMIPYTPYKENIHTIPVVSEHSKEEQYGDIKDLYFRLRREEELESAAKRLGFKEQEMYGIVQVLRNDGREVEIVDDNGTKVIRKRIQRKKEPIIKPAKEELFQKTIGVVSDTHYGSIYSQPSQVQTFAYECYNRGIEDILHVGDISDGDYSRIRPIHNYEVFLYGATGHLDYVVKTLPKYDGLNWHVITGSHDQTHLFNYGMNFGEELAKKRKDVEFLGQDTGMYMLDNCKIQLFHPGGGTSRILSTKPQNGIDQLPESEKVDLKLIGHYHKVYYMYYRDMHVLLCPCNVDQSSFMMKNEIPNLMGDYFLTLYYDEKGNIHYLEPEAMIFDKEDCRKDDYENPRIIRSKIITPRRHK